MSRRRGYETTKPSRRGPGGRHQITRPNLRAAVAHLAEIMRLVGQEPLVDVCDRALDGHLNEQVRCGAAINNAIRLLRPEMPKGSEP